MAERRRMNLQLYFGGFGTDDHFRKQIAVIDEDIRLLQDQRDVYRMVPSIVADIETDIRNLRECRSMIEGLIGTATQCMPCPGLGLNVAETGALSGQSETVPLSVETGRGRDASL